MKKIPFALPVLLLTLFLSGCGKTPDDELKAKVPESANSLCLMDGNAVIRTRSYQEHKKEILKELKKASLPEDVLQCRILIFGSTKEEWGGALIQSAGRQVRKIFDYAVAEGKKNSGKIRDLKESAAGKERRISATVDGKKVIAVLYHENLMLLAVQKTDPAFFSAGRPNALFQDIQLKDVILSAVVKVELPQQGKGKESADMALQMVPALQKLSAVSLNIPFSVDDPMVDFRLIFQDGPAAGEALAAINMGIGFLAQSGEELAEFSRQLKRKTDKNVVSVSFQVKAMEDLGKRMQAAQKKKQEKSDSVSDLKNIGLACKMYAGNHKQVFPPDLTVLVRENYLPDGKNYISSQDKISQVSADKTIGPRNTSYAYVGKGLTEFSRPDLPLAFEKPWLIPGGGVIAVLLVDGRVKSVRSNGKTCKAVAEELLSGIPAASAAERGIILTNAAAVDQTR